MVTWTPYRRDEIDEMELSPVCTEHSELWRANLPLICFFLVEYHLPCRVMRQFGYLQACPVEHVSTSHELHNIDRRSQRGAKNWEQKHVAYINQWNNRHGFIVHGGAIHRERSYREDYLQWLKRNSRLKLKVAMDPRHIEDLPSESEDSDAYDDLTRGGTQPQRGPIEDYLGQQLSRIANEAGQALGVPYGSQGESSALRGFIERVRRGARRMARKMNCIAAPDEAFVAGDGGGAGVSAARSRSSRETNIARSASRSRSTGGRQGGDICIGSPRTSGASRGASRAVSASSRGKEAAVDDSDDEDEESNESSDSEENDPSYDADVIGSSQMPDAPRPTQSTQGTPKKPRARKQRDRTDVGASGNVLPTEPGLPRRKRKPFTPNPTPRSGAH
ncbi:unnamed protein product [Urochloa decumbens]|uniref:Aminotransferase-like plant mobile domain-containing protein n=1 Tax=Urochloa decumbens TaxID=240449 RepID=A0ABC9B9Q4_9POAL